MDDRLGLLLGLLGVVLDLVFEDAGNDLLDHGDRLDHRLEAKDILDGLEQKVASNLLDRVCSAYVLNRIDHQLVDLCAQWRHSLSWLVLADLPEEVKPIVVRALRELGAQLACILSGKLGDLGVLFVLQGLLEDLLTVRIIPVQLVLMHVAAELLVEALGQCRLGELADKDDILFVDSGRRHRPDLLKEAVDKLEAAAREDLLDQIVHCAHHLFVLALLASPDEVDKSIL